MHPSDEPRVYDENILHPLAMPMTSDFDDIKAMKHNWTPELPASPKVEYENRKGTMERGPAIAKGPYSAKVINPEKHSLYAIHPVSTLLARASRVYVKKSLRERSPSGVPHTHFRLQHTFFLRSCCLVYHCHLNDQ